MDIIATWGQINKTFTSVIYNVALIKALKTIIATHTCKLHFQQHVDLYILHCKFRNLEPAYRHKAFIDYRF